MVWYYSLLQPPSIYQMFGPRHRHELQMASQTTIATPLLQEFVQPLCYGIQYPRLAYSKVAYQDPADYLG